MTPEIEVDQQAALDMAFALINGEDPNEALIRIQEELDEMVPEPLKGEKIHLFGNMNEWGKNWNSTPHFKYVGNGVYEASTFFEKGSYEFKIAPMNWAFDYGAFPDQKELLLGEETSLIKKPGSDNLKLTIKNEIELVFSIDLKNPEEVELLISEKGLAYQDDFYFAIESANGGYDSKRGEYWQLYSGDVKEYHNIKLTQEEMVTIYEEFKAVDFTSFPSEFKPKTNSITLVTPSFKYIMESNLGGVEKRVLYDDRETDEAMVEEGKPYLEFYGRIWQIVKANSEVKQVKESNVVWE